jgi:hypothetical protein
LYDLEPRSDGTLDRVRTPVADEYAKAISDGEELLGSD